MGAKHSRVIETDDASTSSATESEETNTPSHALDSPTPESPSSSSFNSDSVTQSNPFEEFNRILATPFKSASNFNDRLCQELMIRSFLKQFASLHAFISMFIKEKTLKTALTSILSAQRKEVAEPLSAFLEKYKACTDSIDSAMLAEAWLNCLIETNNFMVFNRSIHLLNRNYARLLPDQEMNFEDFSTLLANRLVRLENMLETTEDWPTRAHLWLLKLNCLKSEFPKSAVRNEILESEQTIQVMHLFTSHTFISKSIKECVDILQSLAYLPKADHNLLETLLIKHFVAIEENIDVFLTEFETHTSSFCNFTILIQSAREELLKELTKTAPPSDEQKRMLLFKKLAFLVSKEPSLEIVSIVFNAEEEDALEEMTIGDFIQSFRQEQEAKAQEEAQEAERIRLNAATIEARQRGALTSLFSSPQAPAPGSSTLIAHPS